MLVIPMQMQLSVDNAVQAADALAWSDPRHRLLGLAGTSRAAISVARPGSSGIRRSRGFPGSARPIHPRIACQAGHCLSHHTADLLNRSRSADTIQSLRYLHSSSRRCLMRRCRWQCSLSWRSLVALKLVPLVAAFGLIISRGNAVRAAPCRDRQFPAVIRRAVAKADQTFLENARAARAIKLLRQGKVREPLAQPFCRSLPNLARRNARLNMFSAQAAATGTLSNVALIAAATWMVINSQLSF